MIRKFSDFKTREHLTQRTGLRVAAASFIQAARPPAVEPSSVVVASLERATYLLQLNEQIVRESVIFPVLLEVFLPFKDKISLFAAAELKTEGETELNGVCDYLFGGRPEMDVPDAPFICVVEAKKQDFEIGTWQCGAELYACRLKNEAAGYTFPFYFGCVTTGHSWNFIKLEGNLLTRDKYYYTLGNLPELLGAWRWVLNTQLSVQT